jgi:HEAT repeat protein
MASLQGLSAIGTEECSGPIIDMTAALDKDRQDELYEAAIKAIAAIGYNDAVRAALTSQEEAAHLCWPWKHATSWPTAAACPISNRFSGTSAPELQRMAAAELAMLGDCEDSPFFVTIMNDSEDAEVLKSALVFFGNHPTCPDVEDLVFAQIDHKYVDVKEMALEACINLHSPKLNELFKERAKSPRPLCSA